MTDIVVGGAGIGGLAAALAIARGGRSVTIVERRPALAEFGAGVQVAPNATRILARWDLIAALEQRAVRPAAICLRRGRDGAELVKLPLTDASERFGAPFLLVHRVDLQNVLAAAVEATGAITTTFDAAITVPTVTPEGVSLAIAGRREPLVGGGFADARGIHSLGNATERGVEGRLVAWRALVPAEALAPAYRAPQTNLWLGRRTHLVHYPIGTGAHVNIVAMTPRDQPPARRSEEFWSEPGDPDRLRWHFRGWHRDATALIESAAGWRCWPLFDAEPLSRWGEGACTRLGDAAHPMLPFLGQGASQSIEDAHALADALAETADVTAAFRLYERRRMPRAARVQRASRRQGDIYHLGRPASDARDLTLRALGGRRVLAGLDWLYGSDTTR